MFLLKNQEPITLTEFLNDYNQASWLGYISKDADCVHHGQWTVRRAVERDYSGKSDIYLAYNPLKGYTKRRKANIGHLALLYVDLDIGRDENPFLEGIEVDYKQETINALEESVFGVTVPAPNYICDSGRGLYLIYKIYQNADGNKQEHINAAERWERVNSYLTSAFDWYCADKSVSTDEARVLRVPGSLNSHSGTEVKFYAYSDEIYTLFSIERDYMNAPTDAQIEKLERVEKALGIQCTVRNRNSIRRFMKRHEEEYRKAYNKKAPSEKQLKYASDISHVLHINMPNFRTAGGVSRFIKKYQKDFLTEKAKHKMHSTFIMNDDEKTLRMLEGRLKRIEKLLSEAPRDSYRETGLFLYRLIACEYTGDKKLAAEMTLNLLRNMSNPLQEREAMRTTRSAERYWENNQVYRMTDDTIAEWFGISGSEWRELIPREAYSEDKELRRARNRRYYEKKLKTAGEVSKQDKIASRREEISRLLSMGKSRDEVCLELNISIGTYYTDLKYLEEHMIDTEAQDIDKPIQEKLDDVSNSGAIAPKSLAQPRKKTITRASIFKNPFDNTWMYMQKLDREGEWSAILEVPVGYNIDDS